MKYPHKPNEIGLISANGLERFIEIKVYARCFAANADVQPDIHSWLNFKPVAQAQIGQPIQPLPVVRPAVHPSFASVDKWVPGET